MGVSSPMPIPVVLVEPHAVERTELAQILVGYPDRVRLVAALSDPRALSLAVRGLDAGVALIALRRPGLHGPELIRQLGQAAPRVRAVVLTACDDEASVLDAIRAGAHGYLLRDEPSERLIAAIEDASGGGHPVSSRVAGFIIAQARRAPLRAVLSDREEELAAALAAGLTYAESAARMGIAVGTVQDYVKRLYRKLDVTSRREVRSWVVARQGMLGITSGSTATPSRAKRTGIA